ncbi:hypothetical protein EST38_g111 [Candolleomyces aberdarensis]|uniref:RRM domain-containing protein n=1 Tax=Candolleomyces aberdarensis TaxID=2316362 RepID=A0A4Q2E152_9AGAR|nr:hypothetical protein EST38_g111 [Candolleomyces aberdarensis]
MSAEAQAAPVTANGAPAVVEKPQETLTYKVFAGNLSYDTTDDGLKAFFAPVQDDILSVQVIMRGSRSAGYGFVALASLEAAQKAVDALNTQELDGRPVIVEIAKPSEEKKERRAKRRPGRRGAKAVPGEVTEAEANGEAPKAEDESSAEAPKPKKKKKSHRKRRAPAAPAADGEAAPAEAPAAAAENPDAVTSKRGPRVRKPRAPRAPRPAGEDPVGEPSKNMLFVANLGFSVDDAGLEALFTESGITVVSARVVRRRWGNPRKSKGYGFVDAGDEEGQKKAIDALDGKEVAGRAIAVKIAVNTPHEAAEEAKPVDGAVSGPVEVAVPGADAA